MKKVAVFVEGQTEQIFVQKLIEQVISPNKATVTTYQLRGGARHTKNLIFLKTQPATQQTDYYFGIYDCGNDSKVKEDIIEHSQSMKQNGFSLIIGLRDVYPDNDKVASLRKYLNFGIPADVPTHIVLAVNEVEAWFLAEENHYSKIDTRLTLAMVNKIAGIDVSKDSTETVVHPTEKLQLIYRYSKSKNKVSRIVDALDYANLYINVRQRNNSLAEFFTHLDSIFHCLDAEQLKNNDSEINRFYEYRHN
ncbi:MAG: hypothetical protein LBG45_06560 [Dysgonamonadaceae bacterium]|jgi:hypothetical protein|nr:hypothetical protein [Dysgonamonadaceae bacterium]